MVTRRRKGHFGPELFRFLRALERSNRRDWFERNRERWIEHVRDPMLRFIGDFAPRLHAFAPDYVADPAPHGGSMFRIHRDTRFSADKRPYKTAATARFQHARGPNVHTPGFYIHLGAREVYAGLGIWRPDPVALARIRRALVADPARWKRAVSGRPFKASLALTGESLARPPRGFPADHPLVDDLRRKDFIAVSPFDEAAACAPDFLERYVRVCRAGLPLVRYLAEAIGI